MAFCAPRNMVPGEEKAQDWGTLGKADGGGGGGGSPSFPAPLDVVMLGGGLRLRSMICKELQTAKLF